MICSTFFFIVDFSVISCKQCTAVVDIFDVLLCNLTVNFDRFNRFCVQKLNNSRNLYLALVVSGSSMINGWQTKTERHGSWFWFLAFDFLNGKSFQNIV